MAITDLTNTKWIINQSIDTLPDGVPIVSGNRPYTALYKLFFTSAAQDFREIVFRTNYNNPTGHITYYTYPDWAPVEVYTLQWSPYQCIWYNEEHRTIHITGGDDATNPLLIDWFENNASLIIEYHITYHLNDGVNNTDNPSTFTVDNLPVVLEEPTKAGYRFLGWYENADFSGEVITEITTIGDKDLYARWELITYDITYYLNGGVNNAANPATYAPLNLPLTLAAPTKEGHIFLGWYETADFSGEAVTKIVAGTTGNVTLYAKWELNAYKAFEVGDVLPATTQLRISWVDDISHIYIDGGIYSKNGSFTLVETSVSGNIYINNTMIFVGDITNDFIPPYTNYDGNHPYIDIDTSTWDINTRTISSVSPGINMFTWEDLNPTPSGYTISFETNGGTYIPDIEEVTELPISLPIPTKEGYTFVGWYYDSDFTNKAIANDEITENVTLYAKWQSNIYLTDLTGTKWKLNDDVQVWLDLGVTVGTFNINFTSNGNNYTSFTVDHHPGDNYNFIRYDLTIIYRRDMPANNGTWTNNNYKVIEITGGTDVTNTTLINWLGSNATQIIESSGPKPFEVGDILPAGKIKISWDFTGKPIGEDDAFLIISDGDLYIEIYKHEIFIDRGSNYEIVSADTPGYTIITLTEPRTITTFDGYRDYEEYVGDAFLWEVAPSGYTITFDSNGGTTISDIEEATELPTPLPTPTKSGYTFVAWYYESNFQTRAKAGDTIEANTTLYAKWHNLGSLFTEIADAIREKESSSGTIRDVDFGERIKQIQGAIELTQAQYDALETKDANTYYLIVEE